MVLEVSAGLLVPNTQWYLVEAASRLSEILVILFEKLIVPALQTAIGLINKLACKESTIMPVANSKATLQPALSFIINAGV